MLEVLAIIFNLISIGKRCNDHCRVDLSKLEASFVVFKYGVVLINSVDKNMSRTH